MSVAKVRDRAVKFWDSSAVVALLVDEAGHGYAQTQLDQDSIMLVWWATPVECVSALSRQLDRWNHSSSSSSSVGYCVGFVPVSLSILG